MSEPSKNLNSVFLGIGEFSFSLGAASRAAALAAGYRDIGDVMAFTIETENTREETEGSYRTGKRVDKVFSTKQKLEYVLKAREFNSFNLQTTLMASTPSGNNAAAALTKEMGTAIDFTPNVSSDKVWYDLLDAAGKRRLGLTGVLIGTGAAKVAAAEADDETLTLAGHGLANGDRVLVTDIGASVGLTADSLYYVVGVAGDDFQLSETEGGAAVGITNDGNVTLYKLLTEGTDFEVDLRLGRARFLVQQAADAMPFLTAPEITSASDGYMQSMTPLDEPTFEGYGRLVIFDPDDAEAIKYDHRDFSCTIIAERMGEIDGKKPPELNLRVTVTGDEGEVFFNDALADK